MKIKDFIQENWQSYPLQLIGAALIILAGLFGLIRQFGLGWIAFGLTGIITAACAIRNKIGEPTRTVSQWIQDLTSNKPVDYVVGSVIIIFSAWQHFTLFDKIDITGISTFDLAMIAAYWPLSIGLAIHFFANKD